MIFASLDFLIFFLLVLLLQQVVRVSMRTWVLLVASYVFYMSGSIAGVFLILIISSVDYRIGRAIGGAEDSVRRARLLALSLGANLGILGFFKYTNFILENLGSAVGALGVPVQIPHYDLPLPPGISYFTFSSMSYVLDIYYERLPPTRSVSDYLLYISYFPKLLAGPIARAGDFLSQVRARVRASAFDVEIGIVYFLIGAVKKVVIADQVAPHVDLIFAAPGNYDAVTLAQGALGYAVQIYCDFSGYSDMAIGCARIMGIRLPENFAMPYSAISITEFWRRWHITLSNWFRDYVFLPLEMATRGNQYPGLRASLNLMLTMLLCGLWHGASWNFVFWGGLHGAALAVNRAWGLWRGTGTRKPAVLQIASMLLSRASTLTVVLVGWIFFRAESWSHALQYLGGIMTWQDGTRVLSPFILAGVGAVFFTHVLLNKDRNLAQEIPQWSAPARVAAYSTIILLLATLAAADSAPFVYLQF